MENTITTELRIARAGVWLRGAAMLTSRTVVTAIGTFNAVRFAEPRFTILLTHTRRQNDRGETPHVRRP